MGASVGSDDSLRLHAHGTLWYFDLFVEFVRGAGEGVL